MYIEIPESLHKRAYTEDILNSDLRALIKIAHEFARKHITKNETPDSETEESGAD